jgi:type I restriction enzyme S subunit
LRHTLISKVITKGLQSNVSMKDTGYEWIGEIPQDWKFSRIKFLSSLITSGPRGWSDLIDEKGKSVFLQSGDLNDNLGLNLAGANKIKSPDNSESIRAKLSEQDIVVCITGGNTGRVAVASELSDVTFINQHLSLIRLDTDILSPKFVGYLLKSEVGREYFRAKQYGVKEGLSLSDISETIVVYPSLENQEKIVQFLDQKNSIIESLFEKIKNYQEKLRQKRSTLITHAVTGKIDVRTL